MQNFYIAPTNVKQTHRRPHDYHYQTFLKRLVAKRNLKAGRLRQATHSSRGSRLHWRWPHVWKYRSLKFFVFVRGLCKRPKLTNKRFAWLDSWSMDQTMDHGSNHKRSMVWLTGENQIIDVSHVQNLRVYTTHLRTFGSRRHRSTDVSACV